MIFYKMVIHAPLDFQYYFLNIFAGSSTIFFILAMLSIVAMAARFRMNGYALSIVTILFAILMSSYFHSWYVLIMILAGLALIPIIMRIWNRQ